MFNTWSCFYDEYNCYHYWYGWLHTIPCPSGGRWRSSIRITKLFPTGHLPVKLPDYNNRLRVLVATYVTFSPNGTELLVNMGGEQVCMAAQGGFAPPPIFSSQVLFLTSTTMRQTRSNSLIVNDFMVKCRSNKASLEFLEKCPGLGFFLSFRTDRIYLLCTVNLNKCLHSSEPQFPHLFS